MATAAATAISYICIDLGYEVKFHPDEEGFSFSIRIWNGWWEELKNSNETDETGCRAE